MWKQFSSSEGMGGSSQALTSNFLRQAGGKRQSRAFLGIQKTAFSSTGRGKSTSHLHTKSMRQQGERPRGPESGPRPVRASKTMSCSCLPDSTTAFPSTEGVKGHRKRRPSPRQAGGKVITSVAASMVSSVLSNLMVAFSPQAARKDHRKPMASP